MHEGGKAREQVVFDRLGRIARAVKTRYGGCRETMSLQQAAAMKIFENHPGVFDEQSEDVERQLYTIVKNLALDDIRKRKWTACLPEPDEQIADQPPIDGQVAAAHQCDRIREITECYIRGEIGQPTRVDRSLMVDAFWLSLAGFTQKEIAENLDASRETVKRWTAIVTGVVKLQLERC